MSVAIVTAFKHLRSHPRNLEKYRLAGRELLSTGMPIYLFADYDETRIDLDAYPNVTLMGPADSHLTPSTELARRFLPAPTDNPHKDTLEYMDVQHAKTRFLNHCRHRIARVDRLVWIDFGICHLPDVNPEVLLKWHDRVKNGPDTAPIVAPGAWDLVHMLITARVSWYLLGGLLSVQWEAVEPLATSCQQFLQQLPIRSFCPYEVNMWAQLAKADRPLPWHVYRADHNRSMFDNYPTKVMRKDES